MTTTEIALLVLVVFATGGSAIKTWQHAKSKKRIAELEVELAQNEQTHETLIDKLTDIEAERIALKEANEYLKEITGKTFVSAQRNMEQVRKERTEAERAAKRGPKKPDVTEPLTSKTSGSNGQSNRKVNGKPYPRKPVTGAPAMQKPVLEVKKRNA